MKMFLNFAAFQIGWFSCVLGAANELPWAGPLAVGLIVALHLSLARRWVGEAWLILVAMAMGMVADSLLVLSGWVAYPNGAWLPGFAPYWIIAMWGLFATTLNVSMRWLRDRLPLTFLLGAAGGPLSYLAGARLGAMEFVESVPAILALALIWALAMPALTLLAARLDGFSPSQRPSYIREDWRVSEHA
jgi:hypothetical protein